jgi:hypothetical protein
MPLSSNSLSVGIIVMFVTAMMPFSAMIILSLAGEEALILGLKEIYFYLGWFINPIIMIIASVIVMRMSAPSGYSRGILAGLILALVYTAVITGIQLNFTPEGGPPLLPFSGIAMPDTYISYLYELVIKAYVFCIAGGLLGAYTISRQGYKPEGGPLPGG